MSTSDRLYKLGLFVRRSASGIEADLPLEDEALVNPMTGTRINQVSFMAVGDRLMVVDPPDLVGLPPVALTDFDTAGQLRNWVAADFKRMLAELECRSAELRALGVTPRVNPDTLHLTAEIAHGHLQFEISSDKRGNFRIARAVQAGQDLQVPGTRTFELSDFPDLPALVAHLASMVGIDPEPPAAAQWPTVGIAEVAHLFGSSAFLPPQSGLELVVEFRVRGTTYRLAVARVKGRTFRGLLAGPGGKLWAEQFELEQFPGVGRLAAFVLNVPESELEFTS